ncbi:Serine/threonine protein phosphatase, partial [Spraguea lophii 42_110]
KEKMEEEMGNLYHNISVTHYKLRNYEKSLNYLLLSKEFTRDEKIEQRLSILYAKLGMYKEFEEIYGYLQNRTALMEKMYKNFNIDEVRPFRYLEKITIDSNILEYFENYYRQRVKIPIEVVVSILEEGYKMLVNLDTMVHINSEINLLDDFSKKKPKKIIRENYIFGDTHGEFFSTYKIMSEITSNFKKINGKNILFNGDFVDRGANGIETFLFLLTLKIMYPQCIFLNRGNHEYPDLNVYMGFYSEINMKYNEYHNPLFLLFEKIFEALPIAHILNNEAFIVHGGICDTLIIKDFYDAPRANKNNILDFFLWSDPGEIQGKRPSPRGITHVFGEDVTDRFLKKNNLKIIIRSHEYSPTGFRENHNKKVITIFSAPHYCRMQNKAAYIKYKNKDDYKIITFE